MLINYYLHVSPPKIFLFFILERNVLNKNRIVSKKNKQKKL